MRTAITMCITLAVLLTTSVTYAGFFDSVSKVIDTGKSMVQTGSGLVKGTSEKSFKKSRSDDVRSVYYLKKYRKELKASYEQLKLIQRAFIENLLAAEKKWKGKKISLIVQFGSVSKDKIMLQSPSRFKNISLCVPVSCYKNPEKLKFGDVFRVTGNLPEVDPVRAIYLENPTLELLS